MLDIDLSSLIRDLKSYFGITRKRQIADVVSAFPHLTNSTTAPTDLEILADFGEDAAVLAMPADSRKTDQNAHHTHHAHHAQHANQEDNVLLLAADGIMGSLMNSDPYWAGYCSVLVNLHDIAAMGGRAIAMVDVLSVKDQDILSRVVSGMNAACTKFSVPIVGGHIHPDSEYNSVEVSILGTAKRTGVIYSSTAIEDDDIIFAIDLDGRIHPNAKYAWDTTTHKSPAAVREQLALMHELGNTGMLSAGKDISNPGILGTLGMLLESSKLGALVDLAAVPYPGVAGLEFGQWLKAYQGCGFVITCKEGHSKAVIEKFESVGLTAAISGKVSGERKLIIQNGSDQEVIFDFEKEAITGI